MMRKGLWGLAGVVGVTVLAGGAGPVSGQAASQRSQLVQHIDETTLTIDYGRPVARGRSPIFGGVVDWGEVWTPGANNATTLEIDGPITLNGLDIEEGRYSIWMVPAETGPWEVVIEPNDSLFHTEKPEWSEEQVRFPVTPLFAYHAEVLTFSVPDLGPTSATLQMHWGSATIAMAVQTPVTYVVTVEPDDVQAMVGTYEMHWTKEVLEERGRADNAVMVEIMLEGDRLLMQPDNWPEPYGQILLPASEGIFNVGTTINGIMSGANLGSFYEFTVEDGCVTGFQLRNDEDRLMRIATKVES